MTKEMRIRLEERIRVYRDSPGLAVTYVDLAHLIEDLLEMSTSEEIGFKPHGTQKS